MANLPTHYIFNHIPKTAGLSLLEVCRQNLSSAEISPHVDDTIRLAPPARFERYRLIAGHFGLLEQARFSRSRYSMTMLRDPIRTICSTYCYWRKITPDSGVTWKAKELSFAQFVRYFMDSPRIVQNPYTHHFAALGRDLPGEPADGASLLAAAKHNLGAFDFVGISEEFERSARLLCDELGWCPPIVMPHVNRSESELEFENVDSQTMEVLKVSTRLDFELYAYGRALFQAHERLNLGSARSCSGPRCTLEPIQGPYGTVERNRFVPFPVPYAPDRTARIHEVSATWRPGRQSGILEIEVTFRTKVPIPDLVLGVGIWDAIGNSVWGTNTMIEKLELKNEPGCDCRAAFTLQCQGLGGSYSIMATLHQPGKVGFHEHWIDRATTFDVEPRGATLTAVYAVSQIEFRSTTVGIPHGSPQPLQCAEDRRPRVVVPS